MLQGGMCGSQTRGHPGSHLRLDELLASYRALSNLWTVKQRRPREVHDYQVQELWSSSIYFHSASIGARQNQSQPLSLCSHRLNHFSIRHGHNRTSLQKPHNGIGDLHQSKVFSQALPGAAVEWKISPSNVGHFLLFPSLGTKKVSILSVNAFHSRIYILREDNQFAIPHENWTVATRTTSCW